MTSADLIHGPAFQTGRIHSSTRAKLRRMGWKVARISLRQGTKDELLDALAVALDFPAHFGRNWDALNDCLSNLPQAPGTLIEVSGPLAPEVLEVLQDVVKSAGESLAESGIHLRVVQSER